METLKIKEKKTRKFCILIGFLLDFSLYNSKDVWKEKYFKKKKIFGGQNFMYTTSWKADCCAASFYSHLSDLILEPFT